MGESKWDAWEWRLGAGLRDGRDVNNHDIAHIDCLEICLQNMMFVAWVMCT
jgi:hypothetical protein